MEAFSRGIDFDLDLHFTSEGDPVIDVKLYYKMTGGITESRLFTTTFTSTTINSIRLDKLKDFIDSTIVSFNAEEE